ncbi:LysM peptidoglycan-binding domain-containing protein [Streptomyces sp. SID13031]|nr:LysM peptidoglycan-binding domain-containing protein [Streptomyces sp. SID13031]
MASVAVGAVAWVSYGWLVVAVLATVLEQVPGVIGRSASLVATRITSQTSRTLLRSALGVAAVTPLTIGVAQAAPGDGSHGFTTTESRSTIQVTAHAGDRPWSAVEPRSTVEVTGSSVGDWRATEKPSSIELTGSGEPSAALARTGAESRTRPAPGKGQGAQLTGRTAVPKKGPVEQVAVPDRPTSGAPTRYTHLQSGQLARAASQVVKRGDSLWSIAAAELGPHATDEAIAARWPQWYSANRQLIGPDPDLIHPGQVLKPPALSHPVPRTHQEK